MKLAFATSNSHKVSETQKVIGDRINLLDLKALGINEDIPEPFDNLTENAKAKIQWLYKRLSINCLSEDTGLEIEVLNGEPGVYSARYAGPQKSAADNMALVLQKMTDQSNRQAQFRTVVALIWERQEYLFEGIIKGSITNRPIGTGGFGYDPIFVPNGYKQTFGELSADIKAQISHRAKAMRKLAAFFENLKVI